MADEQGPTSLRDGSDLNLPLIPVPWPYPAADTPDARFTEDAMKRAAKVYCDSHLLRFVQEADVFDDCKYLVDRPLRVDPEEVLGIAQCVVQRGAVGLQHGRW